MNHIKRIFKSFRPTPMVRNEIRARLIRDEEYLRGTEIINGETYFYDFVWGYQDGYLKVCCFGGTAFKLKCTEEEVPRFIDPIKYIVNQPKYKLSQGEYEVIEFCKLTGWEHWDYYTEYYDPNKDFKFGR